MFGEAETTLGENGWAAEPCNANLKGAGRNSPLALFFVAATGSKEKIAQEEENKDRLARSLSKQEHRETSSLSIQG